jgi:hypothetical protein
MAYQTISQPAQVLSREITATRTFFANFGAGLARFGAALVANSPGQRRVDQVHALQAKSDAELAAMNLRRDEIVYHVFRDRFFA